MTGSRAGGKAWARRLRTASTGKDWTPAIARETGTKAAHPNARFTVAATNNPALDPAWDDPKGVAIDAFIFGGRRSTTVPLPTEARDWVGGVYMAATMGSETTATAAGQQGVVRRDPHHAAVRWLRQERLFPALARPGREAREAAGHLLRQLVLRKGSDGQFAWPGYGENMRVMAWMPGRLDGTAGGAENVFGTSPRYGDLNWNGLAFSHARFDSVIGADKAAWHQELSMHDELFSTLAYHLPPQLRTTKDRIAAALG